MKKITSFVVDMRGFILGIFLFLFIGCLFLSKNVVINNDMTKYLPKDSSVRIGLDKMKEEFGSDDNGSLNLMFKGLDSSDKEKIKGKLEKIDNVSSVLWEDNSDYNKKDYTLYVVNVEGNSRSKVSKGVLHNIKKQYKNYDLSISGSIYSANKTVLAPWILVVAVSCCLVILILMCESYVEPFLFLITIGIAVVLNKGTNIMFDSVSNVTNSIVAILQLALSMDYSIMLINRYRQELNNNTDKIVAMKKALYKSFISISSSSVTTIVGLLALVFMSFKIGRDLGLVLAKGVFLSLVSIFFVLPGLILFFDKCILKTKKRALTFKLDGLGKFSFKMRYLFSFLIIIVFVGSYLFRGNLGILYTASENDEVSDVFKSNNQMAVIYNNKYEKDISKRCLELEKMSGVNNVVCYGNTINQKLTYDMVNEKSRRLGSDTVIDPFLLKILYYNYYRGDSSYTMTWSEFVNFILDDVYSNDKFSKELDEKLRDDILRLKNFTTKEAVTSLKSIDEISNTLGIDREKLESLLVYYYSDSVNRKMSLGEVVSFLENDVFFDDAYSKFISSDVVNDIDTFKKYLEPQYINRKMDSKKMALEFSINSSDVDDLYLYYGMENEEDTYLSSYEFSSFVIDNILEDEKYRDKFSLDIKEKLIRLRDFSVKENILREALHSELEKMFSIDEELMFKIFVLYYSKNPIDVGLSFKEMSSFISYLGSNTNYLEGIDVSLMELVKGFINNDNDINTTLYSKNEFKYMFKDYMDLIDKVYLDLEVGDDKKFTVLEFTDIVLDKYSLQLTEDSLFRFKVINTIVKDYYNPSKYTAVEMANIFGDYMYKLYAIYYVLNNYENIKFSPYSFVNFMINDRDVCNSISEDNLSQLRFLSNIMNGVIEERKYSKDELVVITNIGRDEINSIYLLYNFKYNKIEMSPSSFVDFLVGHRDDSLLKGKILDSDFDRLEFLQSIFKGVLSNYQYSYDEVSNIFGIDKESVKLMYALYEYKYGNLERRISYYELVSFILDKVVSDERYVNSFSSSDIERLGALRGIINGSYNNTLYSPSEIFGILSLLSNELDFNLVDLVYIYRGSVYQYDDKWSLTLMEIMNYLNEDIFKDKRFDDFIDNDMRDNVKRATSTMEDAKGLLVGDNYSRMIIDTSFEPEGKNTFNFIKKLSKNKNDDIYIVGDSAMAYEMSKSFRGELDYITVITMVLIFLVVLCTFKSFLIPLILVLIIQCAVYITMGILSLMGGEVYFIALLIVQSILMGATIDYAILYTTYYVEARKKMNVLDSVISSYNNSISTILTSSTILIVVTFIVSQFAEEISAKICRTLWQGTLCAVILILFILPPVLVCVDKVIIRKKKNCLENK